MIPAAVSRLDRLSTDPETHAGSGVMLGRGRLTNPFPWPLTSGSVRLGSSASFAVDKISAGQVVAGEYVCRTGFRMPAPEGPQIADSVAVD